MAIALRNRERRKKLTEEYQKEIIPKNILMIGSTGSGKTEIARRLANFSNSPFIKVEATHYTEIGFYGKDVDTIISDLFKQTQNRMQERYEKLKLNMKEQLEEFFNILILDILMGDDFNNQDIREEKLYLIKNGIFDDRKIQISEKIYDTDQGFLNLQEFFDYLKKYATTIHDDFQEHTQELTIKELKNYFFEEFYDNFITKFDLDKQAIKDVEESGIVFIDEIDKIAQTKDPGSKRSPSTDGVQRDLLPLIEGRINTKHILFICAGAFNISKPEDILPELQGRLPVKVELKMLGKEEFKRILTEVNYNLLDQYQKLLETDSINIFFQPSAIERISEVAEEINFTKENFGARRLHQILEYILEDLSFGEEDTENATFMITKEYVDQKLKDFHKEVDYQKYLVQLIIQ